MAALRQPRVSLRMLPRGRSPPSTPGRAQRASEGACPGLVVTECQSRDSNPSSLAAAPTHELSVGCGLGRRTMTAPYLSGQACQSAVSH